VRHLSFLAALPLPVVPVAVVPIAPLLPLPPPLGAGVLGAGALAAAALGAGAAGAAPLKPAVETAVAMAPYFESMPEPSDRSPATATSARHASSNAYSARSWAGSSAANRPRKRSVVSLASRSAAGTATLYFVLKHHAHIHDSDTPARSITRSAPGTRAALPPRRTPGVRVRESPDSAWRPRYRRPGVRCLSSTLIDSGTADGDQTGHV
jgi:hypothetical protein